MAPRVIILTGDMQRTQAKCVVDQAPAGAVLTVTQKAEMRTNAQNRLVHRWFADIARHHSFGESEADIKAECNLMFGRPILSRDDPEWESVFGYIFDALNKPSKLKAIRVLDVPFTRRMGVKQLTEYMDQMSRFFAEQGVILTDPDARRYEQDMQQEGARA
ncbi:MAG: hypothetical protein V7786_01765 [Sulfitobacter litoralis]|uniref:hypothetical protein n=1 Tax=Sulfitobacter litoralis TaxID=335975 RepID=UPI003001C4EA|tara:strand:+ start:3939 stop:4421 length:483 start_codon:yes stop_codon:yes gene_type:complete